MVFFLSLNPKTTRFIMVNCGNCTKIIDPNAVTSMQCVFYTLHFHMRCENVDVDEQKAIAKSREQLKSNIFALCVSCSSKRKSQPGIVFFKDMVDEKEKKWKEESKNNSVKLTVAQNELSKSLSINAVKDERIKALLNDIKSSKKERFETPFKGLDNEVKMKAIEDLVKMQGNSMADMTHAFQAVVQEVNNIKKMISQKPSSPNNIEKTKPTYVEALMRRNCVIQKSRAISINEGNNLSSDIKKDKDFNQIAIDRIRNTSDKINITFNNAAEASKFDTLFNEKYKDSATIYKQKEIEPVFKVVNVPNDTNINEFTEYIYNCNTWIPEGELLFIREYSSNPNVKNFLYKCSTNLLSVILKRGIIRVELKEYYYYEDFNILQCFKCLGYGHSAKNCNFPTACKNCAGDHHHKECTNPNSHKCANCIKIDNGPREAPSYCR